MRLSVDAVIGVRGAAQGTPCGAAKGRGMWLRWGAAWDGAGARHAAAWGAQHGAAQGRNMRLCMGWGAAWDPAGAQRGAALPCRVRRRWGAAWDCAGVQRWGKGRCVGLSRGNAQRYARA